MVPRLGGRLGNALGPPRNAGPLPAWGARCRAPEGRINGMRGLGQSWSQLPFRGAPRSIGAMTIEIIRRPISRARLSSLAEAQFGDMRSEEHTSELQSRPHLVCRLLLEKKNKLQFTVIFQ